MKLVLASKSPRRREILSMVTSDFEVRVSGAEEIIPEGTNVFDVPMVLAKIKAEAIEAQNDEIIIGSDTVVIHDGEILGKPKDKADAVRMLKSFSGKEHYVVSGLAIKQGEKIYTCREITTVKMREMTNEEISVYVERDNPVDKAGAYGIQEMAGAFVEGINGDFYNVVGLPLCKLVTALKDEFGVTLIK